MRKNLIWLSCVGAAVVALTVPSAAFATVLTPGAAPIAIGNETGGYTILQGISGPYSTGAGNASGTLTEYVVSGFAANPFGAADLSFIYKFTVAGNTQGDPILNLSVASYKNFSVDAATLGGQTYGETANLTNAGAVTVAFGAGVGGTPNTAATSDTIIINTNASFYTFGTASLQDNGSTGPMGGWLAPSTTGPNVTVPEPGSMALCASCFLTLGGFGILRRRQRRDQGSGQA